MRRGRRRASRGATTIARPGSASSARGRRLRIECRIPGADCNPYLAFAAALASGLDGIRNRIEPPDCFTGDMYAARDLPRVPTSLREATDALRRERVREAKPSATTWSSTTATSSGPSTRRIRSAVTDWERRRYFERI